MIRCTCLISFASSFVTVYEKYFRSTYYYNNVYYLSTQAVLAFELNDKLFYGKINDQVTAELDKLIISVFIQF